MNEWNHLLFNLNSLTIYRGLLQDPAVAALLALIGEDPSPSQAQEAQKMAGNYAGLLSALQNSGMSLCDYIYHAALYDDNLFTRTAAKTERVPAALIDAVKHDLRVLAALAYLTPEEVKGLLRVRLPELEAEIDALPAFKTGHSRYFADERDWGNELQALAAFCRENGSGGYARYQAAASDEATMRLLFERCEPPVQAYLTARLQALSGREPV
ncbi:MAG: hypothetical protein HFG26_04290 [Provencibacterium sp.]|nr:hypothetical protein [Provencibacterium sp.]